MQPGNRKRVLFIGEAVTLAHVARPAVLAASLVDADLDVHLACDPRFNSLLGDVDAEVHPLWSIPTAQFLNALAKGSPVFDMPTLRRYVEDDLRLIKELAPDIIIGDFRLSLGISAVLANTPYMAIINAYWSPWYQQPFPIPEHPLTAIVGVRLAQQLFRAVRPLAFAYHTIPFNRVRRHYGLPTLGTELRSIYTYADHTLYADLEELIPLVSPPSNHHYIGPVIWSPDIPLPDWWETLATARQTIYVTLGSSGKQSLLPVVIDACSDLPVQVMLARAGAALPETLPGNIHVADYLPGMTAAARADLVICNGGSPTTQQALAAGIPVLGLPSNLDQHLNMQALERSGAGLLVRSEQASAARVKRAIRELLGTAAYTEAAGKYAALTAGSNTGARFRGLLESVLAGN